MQNEYIEVEGPVLPRACVSVVAGTFAGDEIEPGTFHGGEIEPGTFHGPTSPSKEVGRDATWVDDSPEVNPAL